MASRNEVPFFLKVTIFLSVLPFVFRPGEPSGFDLLSSPDDYPLVLSSRRYAPGYSHSTLPAS